MVTPMSFYYLNSYETLSDKMYDVRRFAMNINVCEYIHRASVSVERFVNPGLVDF